MILIIAGRCTRIFVRPELAGILDVETRFPSTLEEQMEHAQAAGA